MAQQNPDRRRTLQMIGLALTASQFPGFSRWACAEQILHTHAANQVPSSPPPRTDVFEPKFFSLHEYATVDHLTELIIPRTDSPGAHDAGVSEFVDLMVAHDPRLQKPFRGGLKSLDEQAAHSGAPDFLHLPADQQIAFLTTLSQQHTDKRSDHSGRTFFGLFRQYTVMGYYTSKIGLQELDYPGLKFYTQSPACPHVNDREHQHLQTSSN